MSQYDQVRALAVNGLLRILEDDEFSNEVIHHLFSENKLTIIDKNFLKALIYGTIERLPYIDELIKQHSKVSFDKIDPTVRAIIQVSLWQIFFSEKIPNSAAVDEGVKLTSHFNKSYTSSYVNAVLRNSIRQPIKITKKKEHLLYGISSEVFGLYKKWYGTEKAIEILESYFNKKDGISVCFIQNEKIKEKWRRDCEALNIQVNEGMFHPDSFYLHNVQCQIQEIPGYQQGWFYVQDESSMMIGLMNLHFKSKSILDACAGQGGKSFSFYQDREQIEITALEPNQNRFNRLLENCSRVKADYISPLHTTLQDYAKNNHDTFDQVVLDVPCSGLGVASSKPEIKLKSSYESIQQYPEIQLELLNLGSKFLVENGILIYSTCTINPDENENLISIFLDSEEGKNFSLVDMNFLLEYIKPNNRFFFEKSILSNGIRILPDEMPLDGFYICGLRKECNSNDK